MMTSLLTSQRYMVHCTDLKLFLKTSDRFSSGILLHLIHTDPDVCSCYVSLPTHHKLTHSIMDEYILSLLPANVLISKTFLLHQKKFEQLAP